MAVCFGFLRFILPSTGQIHNDDIFKDMAHVFVGGLLGVGFTNKYYRFLGISLTLLEVVAFLTK